MSFSNSQTMGNKQWENRTNCEMSLNRPKGFVTFFDFVSVQGIFPFMTSSSIFLSRGKSIRKVVCCCKSAGVWSLSRLWYIILFTLFGRWAIATITWFSAFSLKLTSTVSKNFSDTTESGFSAIVMFSMSESEGWRQDPGQGRKRNRVRTVENEERTNWCDFCKMFQLIDC